MFFSKKAFTTQPLAEEFLKRNGYIVTPKAFLVSLPKGLKKRLGYHYLYEMTEDRALKAIFSMYAGYLGNKEWGSIEKETLIFVGKDLETQRPSVKEKGLVAQAIADKVVATLQEIQANYCEYAYLEPEKGFYTIAYRKADKEKPKGKHFVCTKYMLENYIEELVPVCQETVKAVALERELISVNRGWEIVEVTSEDGTEFYAQKNCKETGFYCKIVHSVSKKYYVLNIYEAHRSSEWLFPDTSSEPDKLYDPIYKHSMFEQLVAKDDYSFVKEAEKRIADFASELKKELAKTWDFEVIGTMSRVLGETGLTLVIGYENLALLWCSLQNNREYMALQPVVQLTRAIQSKPTISELFQIITWAEDYMWGIGKDLVDCNSTYNKILEKKW